MKAKITLLITIVFCNVLFSQSNRFEKGYFIDNKNNKVDCLINNLEWDYNPTQFEYKTDESASPKVISFKDFQEFSVGEEYKFIKVTVKIDKSSDNFANATSTKATNFVEDLLLLRVINEGKANLYSYTGESYVRFFYSIDGNTIEPLSYKLYFDNQANSYRKNETYKQELLNNLKCETIIQNDVERLDYTASSLTSFFIKYNTCSGVLTNKFVAEKKHKTLELYGKAGVGISSFSYDYDGHSADFSKKTTFKLAVEAEINLSNQFKKWSVLIEGGYRQYKNSYYFDYVNDFEVELDYTAIDLSVGLRRYFALNSKSNLFVNGYLTYSFALNSSLTSTDINSNNTQFELEVSKTFAPTFGLGYQYNKKYTLELRYELSKNLFQNSNVSTDFSTIGLMFGYRFL